MLTGSLPLMFLFDHHCVCFSLGSVHVPPPPQGASDTPHSPKGWDSVLEIVLHQLQGYLAQFHNMLIIGTVYC